MIAKTTALMLILENKRVVNFLARGDLVEVETEDDDGDWVHLCDIEREALVRELRELIAALEGVTGESKAA